MIELIGLSKSYGKKNVLEDINLKLQNGMVYGIIGENGAGKTTLFNCIAGMESHQGIIYSELESLKNHLGFLETTPKIMSWVTGKEYLKLMTLARGKKYENFMDLNIFDLPLDEYAQYYSTGMKKKLALTGILLQQNDIYILDEPFSGVDIQSNMLILEVIRKLKAENKLVIIASHILGTLSDICDQILVLNNRAIDEHVDPDSFDELEKKMTEKFISGKLDGIEF